MWNLGIGGALAGAARTMPSARHAGSAALAVAAAMVALAIAAATIAHADLDGHGPDAWRVTGVSAHDRLNARMGPGTDYPVIETFLADERGMRLITCVPFYTAAHYAAMTQAQIDALPPRWCLMRNKAMTKAGWVAQRFITPDDAVAADAAMAEPAPGAPEHQAPSGNTLPAEAVALVRALYDAQARAQSGGGADPLQDGGARDYFTADIVALIRSGGLGAHPLYGAQDFDGKVTTIAPDPDQPMLRGMITINVDFTNFGQPQRAVLYLRADPEQAGAPLRIFRVEHDGWSFP